MLLFGYRQILPHYDPVHVADSDRYRLVSTAEGFKNAQMFASQSEDVANSAFQIRRTGNEKEADELSENAAQLLVER